MAADILWPAPCKSLPITTLITIYRNVRKKRQNEKTTKKQKRKWKAKTENNIYHSSVKLKQIRVSHFFYLKSDSSHNFIQKISNYVPYNYAGRKLISRAKYFFCFQFVSKIVDSFYLRKHKLPFPPPYEVAIYGRMCRWKAIPTH